MSKQVHIPHTNCDHSKTPKARAACRRLRRKGVAETSRAELVARLSADHPELSKDKNAAVAAEITRLENLAKDGVDLHVVALDDDLSEEADIEVIKRTEKVVPINKVISKKDRRAIADAMNAQVKVVKTVQAKGSKVVHVINDNDQFLCTKAPVKDDKHARGAGDMTVVTCKNCLKLAA